MIYGDDVVLTERGIRIPPKVLSPLGIMHKSHVYGVFVKHQDDSPVQDGRQHVIVTPIPPDAWPVTFKLAIRLSNVSGSLAAVTAVLNALDINIVVAEGATSGPQHAALNLTCEALRLKQWAHKQHQQLWGPSRNACPADVQRFAHLAVCRLYLAVHRALWIIRVCGVEPLPTPPDLDDLEKIAAKARELDKRPDQLMEAAEKIHRQSQRGLDGGQSGYLDPRFLYGSRLLTHVNTHLIDSLGDSELGADLANLGPNGHKLFLSRWVYDDKAPAPPRGPVTISRLVPMLRREMYTHISPAVYGTLLPTLFGHWVHSGRPEGKLEFVYNTHTHYLDLKTISNDHGARQHYLNKLELPQRATASFSTSEEYIRIVADQKQAPARPRVRVDIRYEAHQNCSSSSCLAPSTQGLCYTAASCLLSYMNVDQVTSRLTDRSYSNCLNHVREHGKFRFIGRLHPSTSYAPQELAHEIHRVLENTLAPNVHIESKDVRVFPVHAYRVFFSVPFHAELWKNNKKDFYKLCESYGFQGVAAEVKDSDNDVAIMKEIISKIRDCDAFVQLVLPDVRDGTPQWLSAEHALAAAMGMNSWRIVPASASLYTDPRQGRLLLQTDDMRTLTYKDPMDLLKDDPSHPGPLAGVLQTLYDILSDKTEDSTLRLNAHASDAQPSPNPPNVELKPSSSTPASSPSPSHSAATRPPA